MSAHCTCIDGFPLTCPVHAKARVEAEVKARDPHIHVLTVLDKADERLQQVKQWIAHDDLERAAHYAVEAETLLELVEVKHCGSVGGFGVHKGIHQHDTKYWRGIANRIAWLRKVYNAPKHRPRIHAHVPSPRSTQAL